MTQSNITHRSMKQLAALVLIVCSIQVAKAQDLIVTVALDSIECQITKETSLFLYYVPSGDFRTRSIEMEKVLSFAKGHFSQSPAPSPVLTPSPAPPPAPVRPPDPPKPAAVVDPEKDPKEENRYARFRAGVDLGYSYRIAPTPDYFSASQRDYEQTLKFGLHFSGDIAYFLNDQHGGGIEFSRFSSSNSIDNVNFVDVFNGAFNNVTVSDRIGITYIAPSYFWRMIHPKYTLVFGGSIGLLNYTRETEATLTYLAQGNALGTGVKVALDLQMAKNTSITVQVGMVSGTLSEYTVSQGSRSRTIALPQYEYESLTRIYVSVGVRLHDAQIVDRGY